MTETYHRSPRTPGTVKSDLQDGDNERSYWLGIHPIQSRLYSSKSSPSAAATATPLRSLNHTHAGPRGSISYHQLIAIVRPVCRTWCHQPAGRYSVSPASTRIIIGCAVSGSDPGRSGCNIDDQRTGGIVEGEGFRRRGEFADSCRYVA